MADIGGVIEASKDWTRWYTATNTDRNRNVAPKDFAIEFGITDSDTAPTDDYEGTTIAPGVPGVVRANVGDRVWYRQDAGKFPPVARFAWNPA